MNAKQLRSAWALGIALAASPAAVAMDEVLELTREEIQQLVGENNRRDAEAILAAVEYLRANPEVLERMIPDRSVDLFQNIPVEVPQKGGGTSPKLLQPYLLSVLDLGNSLRQRTDLENLRDLYTFLFERLPPVYVSGLPTPPTLGTLPVNTQVSVSVTLFKRFQENFADIRTDISVTDLVPLVTNFIADCTAERGWEDSGTSGELSDRCDVADYAADGLMANVDFVLKDDLTCVKDQGRRGTCVPHGIAAAVETQVMVNGGDPENLAEQDAYFQAKITTDWSNRYSDGLNTEATLSDFLNDSYRIQYEDVWNYNRSLSRTTSSTTGLFSSSCVSYTGEMCTNLAFQAQEDITLLFGVPSLIEYTSPARSTTDGYVISDYATVPDYTALGLPDFQLDLVTAALELETPVLVSLGVSDDFRFPDSNGYVQYTGLNSSGNHLLLLVGFVDNADLPANAPAAADRGYYIAKNSWGTNWGDCGFVYIPGEYLEALSNNYWYLDDQLL